MVVNFRGDLMALIMVNVFTRKVWAVAIKDKTAASVPSARRALISRLPEQPKVVSSDGGLEYAQLSDYLEDKCIGHKQSTADTDKNALAVLDRAVKDVKARFSRILASTGNGDEKQKLEKL